MAEFCEVMRKRKEMCHFYDMCSEGCPLYFDEKCTFGEPYEECEKKILEWEKPIDWSKVKVDTKILVRDSEDTSWAKRHFAKYENNKVYAWDCGTTSYTAPTVCYMSSWKYVKLSKEG